LTGTDRNDHHGTVTLLPAAAFHWSTAWRRLREKLGLPKATRLRDPRHFAATQLLADGVDVKTVAGRLIHADAATR